MLSLRREYSNFDDLMTFFLKNKLMIEETFLVKELLEQINAKCLGLINDNMTEFIKQLEGKLQRQGELQEDSWQKLLMAFIWKVMVYDTLKAIIDEKGDLFEEVEQKAILEFIEIQAWKMDA